jgi:hypothetical protein
MVDNFPYSYEVETHVVESDTRALNVLVTLTREITTNPNEETTVTKTEVIQSWNLPVTFGYLAPLPISNPQVGDRVHFGGQVSISPPIRAWEYYGCTESEWAEFLEWRKNRG